MMCFPWQKIYLMVLDLCCFYFSSGSLLLQWNSMVLFMRLVDMMGIVI